jgi:hypothetical protein
MSERRIALPKRNLALLNFLNGFRGGFVLVTAN